MKILVISDLHINANQHNSIFGWNNFEFIEKIEKIRNSEKIEKIILNGDIFDMYQNSYHEIYNNNNSLIDYLKSNFFYYIKGNHDLLNSFGNNNFNFVNSSGKIIHIEHGHKADFLGSTKLGQLICNLFYYFLNTISNLEIINVLFKKIVIYNDQINRIPRKYDRYKYLTYALKLLKKYDVVILGHTHKLEEHKTFYINKKKKYLNCGSCSLRRLQGIIIDTETLKHKMLKINSKKNNIETIYNDNNIYQKLKINLN